MEKTRLTARDFAPEVLELYDYYVHGRISRREFLDGAARHAAGGLTALALLDLLKPDYAMAQQVAFTSPDILASYITYPSPDGHGEVRAYLVRPARDGVPIDAPRGGVVVVHENRGLNPYIEDVARRVAKAGYIALAPDGLSSVGGYPGNDEAGRELQRQVAPARLLNDFLAAVTWLQESPLGNGRVAITGFCYGGMVANAAAAALPDLALAVPWYGRQIPADKVAGIRAPLLLHFAEKDDNVNAGWPDYEAALKAEGKTYEAHVYPGTNHGFHNDSTPRHDAAAAEQAWATTLEWFRRYLE